MKLSIIIPVYGVEKFIGDCITSCIDNIGNDSTDVEVIVVDDGTIDSSIKIAKDLALQYPYIKFFSQENQGLSMARNNGLSKANGKYVWFIDSDDFIAPSVVSHILSAIDYYSEVDIFDINYTLVDEYASYSSVASTPANISSLNLIHGRKRILEDFSPPVPFHIFKRSFLEENNLLMYPGIYHEDGEFTPRAIWKAEGVVVLPLVAYYYRQRNQSIMHSVNPKKGEDCILVAHRLMDFFDYNDLVGYARRIIDNFISMTYCNGLNNAIVLGHTDRIRIRNAAYEHRCVLKSLRNATQVKYRVLGYLASIFPKHILTIYLLLMSISVR